MNNQHARFERLLQMYPELNRINEKNQGVIESQIQFKQLAAGETMQTREDRCSDLFFVIKGHLQIEKIDVNGQITRMYALGPGEICHEVLSCYMKCNSLQLAGRAMTDMEIALLPMQFVHQYLITDLDFMRFMYTNLHEKFQKMVQEKEEILHEPIPVRLVKFLKNKQSTMIYMTHQEIALDLGTAREVVSRNLKSLEKQGKIKLERNRIKILDLENE